MTANSTSDIDQNLEIAIVRIKTIAFRTNESIQLEPGNNNANVNIGTQTGVDFENNLVAINVKVTFTPIDRNDDILVEGDFQTIFAIKDLKKWKNPKTENEILLPDNFTYTMLTISLSHTRALLSNITANGPFQFLLIPLLTRDWIEKNLMNK